MKKTFTNGGILATCFTLLFSITAFASVTESQAKVSLEPFLPADSTFVSSGLDHNHLKLKYSNSRTQETYKGVVDSSTGALVSFKSESYQQVGKHGVSLTQDQAKAKVTAEISGAEILSVQLDQDDDPEYDVHFKTEAYYGKYSIHAENGTVLEREIKVGVKKEGTSKDQLISREAAINLALLQVSGAVVTDVDLDWEQNVYCYEVELYKDGIEYEVYLNATTGALLHTRSESSDRMFDSSKPQASTTNNDSHITQERAAQIAKEQVPGATLVECKPDSDDGRFIYEAKLVKDNYEYDIEIDGQTGAILKFEKEYDD